MNEVEIPASMFVPCPAAGFKNTRVVKCKDCRAYGGILDAVPEAQREVEFRRRYRVICTHPIARQMIEVDEG